ncbi:hypothetical protein C490_07864 [Natronobacterium gregoryi SP2]|uniref:Uncharacterized protein n=1 Tax=Natronobacterium gregoryi (strain ATCC 43098 / DSM 3393 / CCM 3738 / CIP 104747 / IAM 13177 / JCM 8860 / NBRC 102187 / NCIMB 2189 / SP2) TaxID=797304 RepID=L9Y936_NATGS|nr:hypothetical protein C490_07864 [Natronobacterium gregoryi SP2]
MLQETTNETEQTASESEQLDDADEVHIDVFVHENGSATFVVDYRFENDSDANWTDLQADVEANAEAYTTEERADWSEILEDGQNETERDMEIRNVSVVTDVSSAPRELGHVEFRFEWTSFAYVELNRIEAGDALSGFTLPSDTTLQVFPPDGYVVDAAEPSPDDPPEEAVFWDGDGTEFTEDQPWVDLMEGGNVSDPVDESDADPGMPWVTVFGALALLVAVGAVGWWIRHEEILAPSGDANESESTGATAPSGTDDSHGDSPPPELLSNEERILQLLEQRGGRIKQQEVVSKLDWTEAKTSQVVSGLREDDEIEVFRIGRENVLSLPDERAGDEE